MFLVTPTPQDGTGDARQKQRHLQSNWPGQKPAQSNKNENRDKKRQEEREYQKHLFWGMVMIALGLTVAVSTNYLVMFSGILAEMERSSGISLDNTLNAALVTGTITLLVWITWFVIFSWGVRMRRSWAGFVAYLCAVVFTAVTVIASSIMNFNGLTHKNTRPMFLLDATYEASNRANDVTNAAASAKAVLPSLKALESDSCTLAKGEQKNGLASGTGRGFGAATAALVSTCAGVRSLRESLAQKVIEAEQKTERVNTILEKLLRSVDDRKIPILDREDRFRNGIAELDSLMRSFRNQGLGKAVEAGVSTLNNLVASVDASSGIKGGARMVINGLKQKLSGASVALKEVLVGQKALMDHSPSHRASLTEISVRYWWHFPSHVAIAAFLDVWPLAMYSFGLLYSVRRKKPKRAPTKQRFPLNSDKLKELEQ